MFRIFAKNTFNFPTLTNKIIKRLRSEIYIFLNRYKFKEIGKNVRIYSPLKIEGYRNISLSNEVRIGDKTWLAAMPLTGYQPLCSIGEGTLIGHFNHIYCTRRITIGNNVLTADKVYISDNSHGYENIAMPILKQPIRQLNDVTIGDGSWIGENVCIIGCSIGKHCIIGANSVVTKDIPDYSVAVGCPAKVIKKYDQKSKSWNKIK